MEIIKISCEKVKISLSNEDMEHLQINCDMLDGNDKRSRQALNRILDEVKDKCNFSTYGKKILVQLFPSKDGGCDMFITGISDTSDKKHIPNNKKNTICYKFENLNNLILFCKTAKKQNYNDLSSLYIDQEKRIYYLCIQKDYPLAEEFYGQKCTANCDAYIIEHYKLLIEDVVNTLGEL